MSLPMPAPPETPNIELLASLERERYIGLTGTVVTIENAAIEGYELVFKNGALLDPAAGPGGYTISGRTITLGTALIVSDIIVVWYYFRGTS